MEMRRGTPFIPAQESVTSDERQLKSDVRQESVTCPGSGLCTDEVCIAVVYSWVQRNRATEEAELG